METTASISSGISKISAKRLFKASSQKILANAEKSQSRKIITHLLQNRGSRVRVLLPLNQKSIAIGGAFLVQVVDGFTEAAQISTRVGI